MGRHLAFEQLIEAPPGMFGFGLMDRRLDDLHRALADRETIGRTLAATRLDWNARREEPLAELAQGDPASGLAGVDPQELGTCGAGCVDRLRAIYQRIAGQPDDPSSAAVRLRAADRRLRAVDKDYRAQIRRLEATRSKAEAQMRRAKARVILALDTRPESPYALYFRRAVEANQRYEYLVLSKGLDLQDEARRARYPALLPGEVIDGTAPEVVAEIPVFEAAQQRALAARGDVRTEEMVLSDLELLHESHRSGALDRPRARLRLRPAAGRQHRATPGRGEGQGGPAPGAVQGRRRGCPTYAPPGGCGRAGPPAPHPVCLLSRSGCARGSSPISSSPSAPSPPTSRTTRAAPVAGPPGRPTTGPGPGAGPGPARGRRHRRRLGGRWRWRRTRPVRRTSWYTWQLDALDERAHQELWNTQELVAWRRTLAPDVEAVADRGVGAAGAARPPGRPARCRARPRGAVGSGRGRAPGPPGAPVGAGQDATPDPAAGRCPHLEKVALRRDQLG